jgi:hypothetical protein
VVSGRRFYGKQENFEHDKIFLCFERFLLVFLGFFYGWRFWHVIFGNEEIVGKF